MTIDELLIDFDEMGFVPTTLCENPDEYAQDWKKQLVAEIERLKAENIRLTTKLGQVLLSIDTVKEMNAMCNIEEQVKQAKIDAFNKLKEKIVERMGDREYMGVKYKQGVFSESEIDEMIAEVQNAEDKS